MAGTVRRIRSAIRRFEFERSGLDACLALAGCRCERPLSRTKPGNGMAARRFGWIDGTEFACLIGRALAVSGRASARDPSGARSLRTPSRPRRMATADTDRRQRPCYGVRYLPGFQPASSTRNGADTADATRALVFRRGTRAWCRIDACADLSRTLPRSRPRQGPRGGRGAHQCQSRYGRAGLCRPLCGDDGRRGTIRVAGLPLPGS